MLARLTLKTFANTELKWRNLFYLKFQNQKRRYCMILKFAHFIHKNYLPDVFFNSEFMTHIYRNCISRVCFYKYINYIINT